MSSKVGSKAVDITGQRFGSLVAVKRLDKKNVGGGYLWLFLCDCGAELEKSTGCLIHRGKLTDKCEKCPRETLRQDNNGDKKRTYRIYTKMLCRAFHKREEYQKFYKDVDVCYRWTGEKGFENFVEDMGECPSKNHSLNRVACSNIYSKETCEWATSKTQVFERRILSSNSSGITGVKWRKERLVWEARITIDKPTVIYYGKSFKDAVAARLEAEVVNYGFSKTLGDWVIHGLPEKAVENGLTVKDVVKWTKLILKRGGSKLPESQVRTFLDTLKGE